MINVVTLTGRLVQDPKVTQVNNDNSVCQFTLAVDKKPAKGKEAETNFIDCVAWNKRGEVIAQYVKKGNMFGIQGRLNQRSWEKDGVKHSKIEVIVDDFAFLEPKSRTAQATTTQPTPSEEVGLFGGEEITLDTIPF